MQKARIKIMSWFTLVVVITATIGVNINKLYCAHCDNSHVQVELLPAENTHCCKEECNCCAAPEEEAEKLAHDNRLHSFFKITEDFEIENKLTCNVVFIYIEDIFAFSFPEIITEKVFFSDKILYPDLPPTQELLCTYLC